MTRRSVDNWTLCTPTIPSRDKYLRKMLESVRKVQAGLKVRVLYNCPRKNAEDLASRLNRDYLEVDVLFCPEEQGETREDNSTLFHRRKYGIPYGRNQLLASVKSPLIAFIDDDCTFEGKDIFLKLEKRFRETSLGLIGLPSYHESSGVLIKPRRVYQKINKNGVVFDSVSGIFVASYAQLLRDFKGFNERKERMDWTDVNLRVQRGGYPTGIDMEAGLVRHWVSAPDSLTRTQSSKMHLGMLYCLYSTALEFDCFGDTLSARKMWELVLGDGYYQGETSFEQLSIDTLNIMPQILADAAEIKRDREFIRSLPFRNIMPYAPLKETDWEKLVEYSTLEIEKYKAALK